MARMPVTVTEKRLLRSAPIEEDIQAASRADSARANRHGTIEAAAYDHVVRRIDRNRLNHLRTCFASSLGPDVASVAIILCYENIPYAAPRGEIRPTEIRSRAVISNDNNIIGAIRRNGISSIPRLAAA